MTRNSIGSIAVQALVVVAWASLAHARGAASESPQPGPVVLIGVDGMDFGVIEPLVAQGRLPAIARLIDRGAHGVLRSEEPMRSPALWTTIATGQPREVHRIFDFVTGSGYWPKAERRKGKGAQRLVTSDMRQARALWQYASENNRLSLVVGWLNTWPAEPIKGLMVAPYVALGSSRQTSIKGRIYDDADRQAYPGSAFAKLRPHIVDTNAIDDARMRRLIDEPPPGSHLYKQIPRLKRYMYTVRWSIAGTLTNTAIVESQLQPGQTDLVMTYFDGADTLAHRFWLMRQSLPEVRARLAAHGLPVSAAEELKQRFGGVVDGYYELVDEMVARIAKAAGPKATIMLVSDHGWGSLQGRVKAPHEHVPFDGEHRMDGILIAAGPNIAKGRLEPLALYDIAPTLLYLLGLPVARELPGRVAQQLVTEKFLAEHPPLMLANGRGAAAPRSQPPPAAEDAHFAEQELERLRSLGYVQ